MACSSHPSAEVAFPIPIRAAKQAPPGLAVTKADVRKGRSRYPKSCSNARVKCARAETIFERRPSHTPGTQSLRWLLVAPA